MGLLMRREYLLHHLYLVIFIFILSLLMEGCSTTPPKDNTYENVYEGCDIGASIVMAKATGQEELDISSKLWILQMCSKASQMYIYEKSTNDTREQ